MTNTNDFMALYFFLKNTNLLKCLLKRSTLTGQDRINFIHQATKGIEQNRFSCTYNGRMEVDNVYSLALRVRKFREDCCRHDIHDIFEIIPFLPDDVKLDTNAEPKNLFDNYKDISLDNVIKSTRMYYEHGAEDYLVENIVWSGEKLLNSCEPELRDLILSKALFLPQKEVGGPVYFKIMMNIYTEIKNSPPPSPRTRRIEMAKLSPSLSLSNLDK
jgi:hypothetical protein